MDLVFKSVGADHGCFVLRDDAGKLIPKAVRYREGMNRRRNSRSAAPWSITC
jgi:hypothetical protein